MQDGLRAHGPGMVGEGEQPELGFPPTLTPGATAPADGTYTISVNGMETNFTILLDG